MRWKCGFYPEIEEQQEVISALDRLNEKTTTVATKRDSLQDLFRTHLHELMTAQTCIHNTGLREKEAIA